MKSTGKTFCTLHDPSLETAAQTAGDRREPAVCAAEHLEAARAASPPNPEVPEKTERRRFTVDYKRKILKAADRCRQPGEIGALLRREGLYSSHLTCWRHQAEKGMSQALSSRKRGPAKKKEDPAAQRIRELERQLQTLQSKLKQAELIIEAQKKIAEILQIACPSSNENSL
jgi:transposase